MKATKKAMMLHTTQHLIDYVEGIEAKFATASPYARRLRLSNHNRNIGTICHEIQRRQIEAMKQGLPYAVFNETAPTIHLQTTESAQHEQK
jgi:hypothetical protein